MTCLFIASSNEKAGKTMLAAGLAQLCQPTGRRIVYLKVAGGETAPDQPDPDTAFVRSLPGVSDQTAPPAALAASALVETLRRLEKASGDLVVIEGRLPVIARAAESLNGRVLVVHDFAVPLAAAWPEYQDLGGRLGGIIINKVPQRGFNRYSTGFQEQFSQAGLPSLGIIPEDRLLMALSVADLAVAVNGKILNNEEKSGDLIENLMLGSSTFDRGAAYYSRKPNKAVFLWGDRPGFRQAAVANYPLFALSTSTRCIVIAQGVQPVPVVAQKAAEQQVPLISAPGTLPQIVEAAEKAFQDLRFQQPAKLPRLLEILSARLDLKALETLLSH